jgi:hypothetical protein
LPDRRHILLSALGAGLTAACGTAVAAPDMEAVRDALKQAVGPGGQVAGMVALAIDADGATSMVTYGSADGVALDGDAVFPIMSTPRFSLRCCWPIWRAGARSALMIRWRSICR